MKEKDITKEEKLFLISENRKIGFIDKTGKVVIEPKFDYVKWFSEGLADVKIEGRRVLLTGLARWLLGLSSMKPGLFPMDLLGFLIVNTKKATLIRRGNMSGNQKNNPGILI